MSVYYSDDSVTLYHGDALEVLRGLPDGSVDCCVTSPPYFGLRDYGTEGQYGLEASPAEYVETMRALFAEVRRVLADDGTLWLNLGSSYMNGSSPGPQGKTSQRAGRTFTANDGVEARRDARPYGTACTERSDSTGLDSSYFGLCDGCEAALSHRNADMRPPLPESVQPHEQTTRGNARRDSSPASPGAEPRDVQESTTPLSSQRLPAACSHCDNCGICLAVLRSSSRDARLCARKESYTSDTSQHGSESHNRGTDASGMAWLNYIARLTPKSLIPIPWMVAMSLQADGWILRNDVIWAKPNAMPESVTDRLSTKHEHLFMFAKQPRYWFDLDPIRERPVSEGFRGGGHSARSEVYKDTAGDVHRGMTADNWVHTNGRNPGDVWIVATVPYPGAHFAVMPQTLASRAIQAGCKPCGTVLDPFSGSGTTGLAAAKHGRRYVGIDLNADYLDLSLRTRLAQAALFDGEASA